MACIVTDMCMNDGSRSAVKPLPSLVVLSRDMTLSLGVKVFAGTFKSTSLKKKYDDNIAVKVLTRDRNIVFSENTSSPCLEISADTHGHLRAH